MNCKPRTFMVDVFDSLLWPEVYNLLYSFFSSKQWLKWPHWFRKKAAPQVVLQKTKCRYNSDEISQQSIQLCALHYCLFPGSTEPSSLSLPSSLYEFVWSRTSPRGRPSSLNQTEQLSICPVVQLDPPPGCVSDCQWLYSSACSELFAFSEWRID